MARSKPAPRSQMDQPVLATGATGFVEAVWSGERFKVLDKRDPSVFVVIPVGRKEGERKIGTAVLRDVSSPVVPHSSKEQERMPKAKGKKKSISKATASKRKGKAAEEEEEDEEEVTTKKGKKVKAKADDDDDDLDLDDDEMDDDETDEDDEDGDDEDADEDADTDEDDEDGDDDEGDEDDGDEEDEEEEKPAKGKKAEAKDVTPKKGETMESALLRETNALLAESNRLSQAMLTAFTNAANVKMPAAVVAKKDEPAKGKKEAAHDEEEDAGEESGGGLTIPSGWVHVTDGRKLAKGTKVQTEFDPEDGWQSGKVIKTQPKTVRVKYDDGESVTFRLSSNRCIARKKDLSEVEEDEE